MTSPKLLAHQSVQVELSLAKISRLVPFVRGTDEIFQNLPNKASFNRVGVASDNMLNDLDGFHVALDVVGGAYDRIDLPIPLARRFYVTRIGACVTVMTVGKAEDVSH